MLHHARLTRPRLRLLSLLTSLAIGLLTCVPSGLADDVPKRKIYFYHPDHLGSTTLVTDEQGQVVERVEYTPYGSTSIRQGPANVAHQFTGQRQDATTGLYFYRSRYYDALLGRFIQPDTIVPDPANPQALNRYSYAQNNPLTFTDPSGHKRRSFFRALFAAVAAVATTIITGGQGELGIAVYSAIAAAGAIVGDQVGKAADRAASATLGASSTAAAGSSASLLGTIMPASTTVPTPSPTPPGDSWSAPQRIIVGDVFPGPDLPIPGDGTPDTPSSGLVIDGTLPPTSEPLYNALNTSETPKPTEDSKEDPRSERDKKKDRQKKPNKGSQADKNFIEQLVKEISLSRVQREKLHRAISHGRFSEAEIKAIAQDIKHGSH